MLSTYTPSNPNQPDGLRAINLRTDLSQLADLIELAFANTMDNSGRAALNEMRQLSRLGIGISLFSRMGSNPGYVWMEGGRLIGNVSIYPSSWPRELGETWIIANVAVHPDYQRRGIARQLMQASMNRVARIGGHRIILHVEHDNTLAHHLYQSLGFVDERTWVTWKRNSFIRPPAAIHDADVYIRHRRRHEWQDEMQLARQVRPQEKGGLGWQRPLQAGLFCKSLWSRLIDWLTLRSVEHLIIRDDDQSPLAASLWIERIFNGQNQLTLMTAPAYQGFYDDLLLNTAVRRLSSTSIVIEHPLDEEKTNESLLRHRFIQQRTLTTMRWDVPPSIT